MNDWTIQFGIRIALNACCKLSALQHGLLLEFSDHMTNRSELQNEYHGLINKLNSTNRNADQKTEVVFSIRELAKNKRNLVVTVNFEKYLSFGELTQKSFLKIDPNFEYQAFAEYIQISIRGTQNHAEIILAIRWAINRLFSV